MSKIIISDTSCIVLLSNIGEMDILRSLFKNVYITTQVAEEFGAALPDWFIIENPKNQSIYFNLLEDIGRGESSSIALALEKDEAILILDDNRARKIAKKLHLEITGTLGVIILAKRKGIIKEINPIINKIIKTNFRISEQVINEVLKNEDETIN